MGGGHHHHSPEAMPKRDQDLKKLDESRTPYLFRDTCAHLLLPLNECRKKELYNPFRCDAERHLYEECQFIAWEQRVEKKKNQQ